MKLERLTKKFFDGLEEGVIYARKCTECGAIEFPPHYACNTCGYNETTWITLSGKGRVESLFRPEFITASESLESLGRPYCFGRVALEEGCSINAVILGVSRKNTVKLWDKLPLPVHAVFTEIDGYKTLHFMLDEQ